MLYIPQEVKEKLDKLEESNAQLQAENERIKSEAAFTLDQQKKKSSGSVWLIVILVLAVAYIGYLQYQLYVLQKAASTAQIETIDAVVIKDGEIEKWSAANMQGVIYRVQLGAYEGFDLSTYKESLDGLHQDDFDGYTKVSLGAFSKLEDAQNFLQEMLRLELENVFIVAYKQNEPIGLIEAQNQE